MALTLPLDDLEKIKSVDKDSMCKIQVEMPEFCEEAVKIAEKLKIPDSIKISKSISITYKKPRKIVIAGVGGSAVGGDLLRTWLNYDLETPIIVSRNYHLPAYADHETLVFVVSYSGNTEETLSSFIEAVQRGCMIVGISSDGQLQTFCQKLKIPFIKLPAEIAPRTAIPYLFFPMVIALEKFRILKNKRSEINEAICILKRLREEIRPEIPTPKNIAKQVAFQLKGTIPVIYGFGPFESVAMRMKTQFNENSKIPAKYEVFPELSHNELVGWEGHVEFTNQFSILLIRDPDESQEIKVRIDATKKLLKGKVGEILELYVMGEMTLAKMLSAMYIGDFASLYLAILYNVDPTPVASIMEMKETLRRETNTTAKVEEQLRKLIEG